MGYHNNGFGMLIAVIIILATMVSLMAAGYKRQSTRKKLGIPIRKPHLKSKLPPQNLGVRENIPLETMIQRMEEAFDKGFGAEFKEKVLFKYPEIKSSDYEWSLFELKRYFVMCVLLKQVPMFSEPIDLIWHEMLLYSREYQRFCEAFAGRMIHHSPHTAPQPMANERAWFDWVYCELFDVTPYSNYIWNGFFRHPIAFEHLQQFEQESEATLTQRFFHTALSQQNEGVKKTIRILILKLKEQIKEAKLTPSVKKRQTAQSAQSVPILTAALVYYSLYDQDNFGTNMSDTLTKYSAKYSGSTSSCGSTGSYDGGLGGGGHHHSCSGGHSGCGSSCSSGCGSSCSGGN